MATSKLSLGITIGGLLDKTFGSSMRSAQDQVGKVGDALNKLSNQRLKIEGLQKAETNLEQLRGELLRAQRETMGLKRDMAATGGVADTKLSAALARSERRAQALATKVEAARVGMTQAKAAATAHSVGLGHLGDELNAVGRAYDKLATKQQRFKNLEQAKQNLGSAAGRFAGTAATVGAAGYGFSRVLTVGVEFESSMSSVQALTRTTKDSPEFKALQAQARALGASTSFSAMEVAEGQGFLAMAGFTSKQIEAAMPGMLALSKAGKVALDQTADIASNILTGFGLQAQETSRLGDVLSATLTRSNVDLSMLGDTMKYVAPQAAAAGASIEVAAAMAGKLGDAGIQGSMAGTAMRSMFSRLAGPPKMAADALAELGIKTKTASGDMRPIVQILKEIDAKTKDVGSGNRIALLKQIFGEEASAAGNVLAIQAGTGALDEFIGKLQGSAGESQRMSKIMDDNMAGGFKALGSALSEVSIAIGQALAPSITAITSKLVVAVRWVGQFAEQNPILTKSIVAVGAALGGLALASSAFGLIAAGIKLMGVAWMANPIGAAITALVLAGVALYSNWDLIKQKAGELGDYLAKVWGGIKTWFSDMATSFTTIGGQIIDGLIGGIMSKVAAAKDAILSVGAGIKTWFGDMATSFTTIGGQIIDGLIGGITSKIGAAKDAILSVGTGIKNWFTSALGIKTWFSDMATSFTTIGGQIIDGLIGGITSKIGAAKDAILSVGAGIKEWFTGALGIRSPSRVFMGYGENISEGAAIGIGRGVGRVGRAMGALVGATTVAGAAFAGGADTGGTAGGVGAPAAIARAATQVSAPAVTQNFYITQNAGESAQALAERVAALVLQQQAQRSRAALVDIG